MGIYGNIRADSITTSTQTITFDELAGARDAYQIALDNGFQGTEEEWLASLVGPAGTPGVAGADGASAYAVAVANGFQGTEAQWLVSLTGAPGPAGEAGSAGEVGASAYAIAVANGFQGSEVQWLASLVGPAGSPGADGADGADGSNGVGVPTGGSTGQVLSKTSAADFDTAWINPPASAGGGDGLSTFLLMGS